MDLQSDHCVQTGLSVECHLSHTTRKKAEREVSLTLRDNNHPLM